MQGYTKRRYVERTATEQRELNVLEKQLEVTVWDIVLQKQRFSRDVQYPLSHSAFQHLYTTLITYSTFSSGEDHSLDQQDQEDKQRTFYPGNNIFKLFRLVYHPSLQRHDILPTFSQYTPVSTIATQSSAHQKINTYAENRKLSKNIKCDPRLL